MQTSSDRKATDQEAQVSELRAKLDVYEKLEKELDDVVMQAAESKPSLPFLPLKLPLAVALVYTPTSFSAKGK